MMLAKLELEEACLPKLSTANHGVGGGTDTVFVGPVLRT